MPVPSADSWDANHADFLFSDLLRAYHDCRRNKRNTISAVEFELNYERELIQLRDQLRAGTYRPGRSICFVVTSPKPREVWAAAFPDRIEAFLPATLKANLNPTKTIRQRIDLLAEVFMKNIETDELAGKY